MFEARVTGVAPATFATVCARRAVTLPPQLCYTLA
jgi:hypothetical protein